MKKILVTGTNSYIGTSLEKWLSKYPDEYNIDSVDMKVESWRDTDFSKYDVVFHVAAVVHKKEKPEMKSLYTKVNRDLPIEVAKKAKEAGVKQFIFMSTMAVYGEEGKIGEDIIITKQTLPNPKTYYGESKLQAENEINNLADKNFKVLVLRPPMIYGPNCPGNYARLEKLALKTPVFPMIDNKRSMLHIDNLSKYMKEYIDKEASGMLFPQDGEYANTSFIVKKLAEQNGKKIILSRFLGLTISILGKKVDLINKVFGNLVYQRNN